jgi:hypothetical protein
MLAEREDLIAPHPPHIMRDIVPILNKFGDLEEQTNLKVNFAHFVKLEMSCSLNLTIYYRQLLLKTDLDRSRLCFRRIEPGSMDRYPRASDQIQAHIDSTRSSALIGMFSVQREIQCCEEWSTASRQNCGQSLLSLGNFRRHHECSRSSKLEEALDVQGTVNCNLRSVPC